MGNKGRMPKKPRAIARVFRELAEALKRIG